MGITGDCYVAEYEGHIIQLVRNNWLKTLTLRIDNTDVASASRVLPHNITLEGTFEHHGVQHTVTVKSVIHHVLFTKDTIEVDGVALPLAKKQ